uniref:Uncharacterized protein n=1 Tax=Anguilla anguilla TaxID=7936 RepID=A0A0E9VEJ3_ANGAN
MGCSGQWLLEVLQFSKPLAPKKIVSTLKSI